MYFRLRALLSPISLVILLIHSASSLCFLVAIFLSKIVRFLWHRVVGMFLCYTLLVVDRIFFRCFGMSCFVCIVLPFFQYVFNLPSFACTFWFISSSCAVIFSCVAFSFSPTYFGVFLLFYHFGLFS